MIARFWGGGKRARLWDLRGSGRHAYVLFGDDDLEAGVRDARADLDARLAEESADIVAAVGTGEASRLDDEYDDAGAIRAWLGEHLTIRSVPVDDARRDVDATAAPSVADASHAVRIEAPTDALLYRLAPQALLATAAAAVRKTSCVAYDPICARVVPQRVIDDPFAGLADRAAGPHVVVRTVASPVSLAFETLGLEKFGIFEIALRDVPTELSLAIEIVRGTAQTLVWERPADACAWDPGQLYVSPAEAAIFAMRETTEAENGAYALFRAEPSATGEGPWAIAPGKRASDARSLRDALRTMQLPDSAVGA